MLIEFKCRNFLSFKDEVSLNMTTISYNEHMEKNIIKHERFDLLKSIAIFGSNGGGKSNLTKAIALMDNLVHTSFRDSLNRDEDRKEWDCSFELCTTTKREPSMFELSFIIDNCIYRYGFEMFNWEVISEWLYKTEKRETLLFKRTKNDYQFNENSFEEGKKNKQVNSNVLFLSFLAQYNIGESGKVFDFFRDLNVVDALDDNHTKHVTRKLLKDDTHFNKWLSVALKFLEINSIHLNSENSLLSEHAVYDNNNLLIGHTYFNIESKGSEGTKKLISLLGTIYDTLKYGKVFFIDEFNSKLHPNLSIKIINLFHEFNNNGAQFIITAHDPTLLDKEIFRRDQIWFVDKNQFGASELYPMSDFKTTDGLRSMSDFRKKYLNSDFGAAESINLTKEFINLTNEI